ncbi:MAG TPA: polysaccharide biosynthesis/export family protein [Rhizomicrobium sp.]|nr:polysaccharide biosynthesis/export family protein [Rhizomicrobium sp.]
MKTRSWMSLFGMAFLGLLALGMTTALAQNAAPAPRAAGATPEQNYILGPEDVLQVDALGRSDFSTRAKIGSDGTIQLPYLGTVQASNRSTAQLRDDITQALLRGGFFAKPIVQVEVVSYASRYVTVLGSVGTPGLIPVDRPYRLSEIMAKVGGIKEGGADYIMVRSPNGTEHTYSIKGLATGDDTADPYAQPGDKIFSPQADIFYIKGQVKAPGGYPISPDMTLVMALARGGGLTDQGSDSHIKIVRKNTTITPRDLNVKIEPDDVIDVGEGWF